MSEKKMILEMLQNGEISADEAERLLYALPGKERHKRRDKWKDFENGMDDIRDGIDHVFRNIHKFDVSKVVREVLKPRTGMASASLSARFLKRFGT